MYQRQVLLQCEFALIAIEEINAGVAQRSTDSIHQIFYGIQNFLNAAANISKAFWGTKGKRNLERKALSDSIGVTNTSPLHEVYMRNNFEHFDERLDRWWKDSSHHNYIDLNIMPRSAIGGVDDNDIFRMFDPTTTDLIFWSERFNIQAIVNEIQRILQKLKIETAKLHWE
ncbi:hypothetical protein ACFLTT_02015 [Chloroflexota bacterium]